MGWFKSKAPITSENLNDKYHDMANALLCDKRKSKNVRSQGNGVIFVLEFNGDIMASQAGNLAHEINSILSSDVLCEEVIIKLNSPGGAAHAYGYAASQLNRIKKAGIKLTVTVDKVAASGGYMMACVADKIIAAPFAIIGSIGVVAEFPNFSNLLKKLDVDYKQYTAGKYKRTVGTLTPIDEESEGKFKRDLEQMHRLFKNHVTSHRSGLNIDKVATGEYWQGADAHDFGLVDELKTFDEYLLERMNNNEIYKISYSEPRQGMAGVLARGAAEFFQKIFLYAVDILNKKF